MRPAGDRGQDRVPDPVSLAREILAIGFRCRRCSACCRGRDSLVLVMPGEVHPLLATAGGAWKDIVEPYPQFLEGGNRSLFTFGWCLRRESGSCRFLADGRCTVYGSRPRICRTYPFILSRGQLKVSSCAGLGSPMTPYEAQAIARDLLEREAAEKAEEAQVARILTAGQLPPGRRCVVDTEGIRVLDG